MGWSGGSKARQGPRSVIRIIPRRTSRLVVKIERLVKRPLEGNVESGNSSDARTCLRDARGGEVGVEVIWLPLGISVEGLSVGICLLGRRLTRCITNLISGTTIKIIRRRICPKLKFFMPVSVTFSESRQAGLPYRR